MGLLSEGINEVIATTSGNAAPMGIIWRDGAAKMVIYRGSHTADRVREGGWLVGNFTHDPVMYVRTAFEDLPPEYFVSEEVQGLAVERLAGSEAWAAFSARVARETREALMVELEPLEEHIISPRIHPVNRGFNSVIEAAVHATRYIRDHDPALRDLIRHHAVVVRRCGGKRELEALSMLEGFLAAQVP
jgi:hypothetical protein